MASRVRALAATAPPLRLGRAALTVVLVAIVVLPLAGRAADAAPADSPAAGSPPAGSKSMEVQPAKAQPAGPRPGGRVVVIGVPGLLWRDVTSATTPTLWRLTGAGSAGTMSVRTVQAPTCPVDGWLTVSAGNRAEVSGTGCGLPPAPVRTRDGARFPDFEAVRRANAETPYSSRVGLLGETVRRFGGCTTAVGPGAALGAAGPDGRVDAYRPSIAATRPGDWSRCPLTIVSIDAIIRAYVDAGVDVDGEVPLTAAEYTAAVRAADRAVGAAVSRVPADSTVLVAGVSDTTETSHLHVAIATGPGPTGEPYRGTYLTTSSTRRPHLVQLTDVTPTVLRLLGLPVPAAAVGSPWRPGADHRDGTGAVVAQLRDVDRAAQAMDRSVSPFFTVVVLGQLALYALAAAALRRGWTGIARRRVLAWTRRVALVAAAVPVATFLANVLPWWRFDQPMLALAAAVLVADLAVVALAVAGPWRRSLLGPATAVAGTTAVVLAIDVTTGSSLQLSSLMGYSPVLGGRFYGFGNPAYALFATGTLLLITGLAEPLRQRGRPRAAVAAVVALGAGAVVVDGSPWWGSDVGGVLALVPGLAVLALAMAGKRITAPRLAVAAAGGAAVVAALAYLDYLRPPDDRTHLGRFAGDVLGGSAGTVLQRKLTAMLGTFGNYWLALLVPFAVAFLVFVLLRPARWRAGALQRAFEHAPGLRSGLLAVLVTAVVGFAVNDSGIAVPAVSAVLAVPLALVAGVMALQRDDSDAARSAGADVPEDGRPPRPGGQVSAPRAPDVRGGDATGGSGPRRSPPVR